MKHLAPLALLAAAAGLPACHRPPQEGTCGFALSLAATGKQGGPVVARFGGESLTAAEVTEQLNQKNPFERASYTTPERKRALVDSLATFELLAQEAARQGLEKDPDVVHAAKEVMVRKLIQKQIDESPEKNQISDDDLHKFYRDHIDNYVRPATVRLSAILLAAPRADRAACAKAKAKAHSILADLRAKKDDFSAFGQAARSNSDDADAKQASGDLGFLSQDQMTQRYGPELAQAAFALANVGQLSEPVQTDRGYYLLKLSAKIPAFNQTFDHVKDQLKGRLWNERRMALYSAFLDDLKKKGDFAIDDEALAALQVSPYAPTNGPPGMPPYHLPEAPPGMAPGGGRAALPVRAQAPPPAK